MKPKRILSHIFLFRRHGRHGKILIPVLILAGGIVFVAVNAAIYVYSRSNGSAGTSVIGAISGKLQPKSTFDQLVSPTKSVVQRTVAHSPTPSPTPRPLFQGKSEFQVTSKNITGPRLFRGSIDPYDPKVGEKQTLILYYDERDITKMETTVVTDTAKTTHPMTFKGDHWEGSWTMDSLHNYRYILEFDATNPKGSSHVELNIR